jgi:transcription antitermination factor NusG
MWYALKVLPRNEFKISEIFRNKLGLETKVPVQKVVRWKNGKRQIQTRPLLGSYVFIFTKLKTLSMPLLFSPGGVFGFVNHAGKPAPIPDEQLYSLEKLSESDKPVYEIDYDKLKTGDRVEVIYGPLRGAVGKFVKSNQKTGRLILCLDLFKRALVTELEVGFVRPY